MPGTPGSLEHTDDDQVDDEKMKAFTSFLRHQFQEYERTKTQLDRRQSSQDPDHPQTYGSPSHAKNGVATAAKPTTVPPEVLALILEKTTQPSGPYAFAKRASGAGKVAQHVFFHSSTYTLSVRCQSSQATNRARSERKL